MKLWYVLAGLSAVGIAVTSVVAYKKEEKRRVTSNGSKDNYRYRISRRYCRRLYLSSG